MNRSTSSPEPTEQEPEPEQEAELVQLQYNAGPPLLSETEPPLTSPDDFVPQEHILLALFNSNSISRDDAIKAFRNRRLTSLPLSFLRYLCENGDRQRATGILSRRNRIDVDEDMTFDPSDGHLYFTCDRGYIDYILIVPRNFGFLAILPNEREIQYSLHLRFNQRNRFWKCNKGSLGFPSEGAMLYIGESPNEHIWLGMVLQDFYFTSQPLPEPRDGPGDPRLTEKHYLIVVMMFAHFFQEIGFDDVTCYDAYPELTHAEVTNSTNLL